MPTIRIVLVVLAAAIASVFGAALYQSQATGTQDAHQVPLLRVADENTNDGTETQDPEQQEQQEENQQECGNPNGCG
jgi:hypothetical protein